MNFNQENVIEYEIIRKIYLSFCDYLETKPHDEKHQIIIEMNLYSNQVLNNTQFDENNEIELQALRQHLRTEEKFRTFLACYRILNNTRETIEYRQQILNMRFNTVLFEEGFELFNLLSNNSLK